MGILADHTIRKLARERRMIVPFAANRMRRARISFGASCYGYDFRLADEFKVPHFGEKACLDPKDPSSVAFEDRKGRSCLIPPGAFILGRSLEYFRIPRDILVICQGKSTYARCGLILNVTPLEPEWEGYITISLVNAAPVPIRVHAAEGIGQALFFRAESACEASYADRKGKYQRQRAIQTARL